MTAHHVRTKSAFKGLVALGKLSVTDFSVFGAVDADGTAVVAADVHSLRVRTRPTSV